MAPLPPRPVVLVTGCTSGGIGWHTAAALAGRGAVVYATARRLEAMGGLAERGCRLLRLDVTDTSSIEAAVAAVMAEAGQIDGGGRGRAGVEGGGEGGGGRGGGRVRDGATPAASGAPRLARRTLKPPTPNIPPKHPPPNIPRPQCS
jgi:NAD(P)-dependent dehydrogenase (short-subunit alcohol dehydrogenase family)